MVTNTFVYGFLALIFACLWAISNQKQCEEAVNKEQYNTTALGMVQNMPYFGLGGWIVFFLILYFTSLALACWVIMLFVAYAITTPETHHGNNTSHFKGMVLGSIILLSGLLIF
jgi:hypothetical protein